MSSDIVKRQLIILEEVVFLAFRYTTLMIEAVKELMIMMSNITIFVDIVITATQMLNSSPTDFRSE